tara:strand:+ start:839 stop:1312 length:474 start_codon:yes stop_codon:yes gene_type:complete
VKIKLLILDVDGTMTNGQIHVSAQGELFKSFNAKDGHGIRAAIQEGVEVAIISTSNSRDIIGARMQMLGISRYYAGPQDKLDVLGSWMQELSVDKESIAFIGDDLNDKTIMAYVGMAACPQDAVEEIKLLVDVVLSKKGGEGCVREFIDRFILSTED